MRLRDAMSLAVRSALADSELEEAAKQYNEDMGTQFMSGLGAVKKEKK